MKLFVKHLGNYNWIIFTCLISIFSACKKDIVDVERRSFKPSNVSISTGETKAEITWATPILSQGKPLEYTVEIAKDSLFASGAELSMVTDSNKITLTSEQLALRTNYYARVKANNFENQQESKWMTSKSFKITGTQIFTTSASNDAEVLLAWRETAGLTKIVVTPEGGTASEILITSTDIENKKKLISNLESSKVYSFEIYAENISKGFLTVRTKSPSTEGNIVDLRSFSDTDVFADTLLKIPSGSTVILKRGLTYTVSSTINIDRSLTIQSGDDLLNPEKATIFLSSNFNFAANTEIDSIVFKNVVLKSDGYTSKYVFNINAATTIGKIVFESCKAEIFRGFIRMQTAASTINNLTINDSVIDSIGNFGVINIHAAGKINNISVRNSTIYKVEKFIVGASSTSSLVVENCTFNEVPLGGTSTGNAYLIDYGTSIVVSSLKFTNNIVGTHKRGGLGTSVRGIRTAPTSSVEVANTYITADFLQGANAIPSTTLYSKNASNLFTDPANGFFTIEDASFAGKSSAGDPRWRIQ